MINKYKILAEKSGGAWKDMVSREQCEGSLFGSIEWIGPALPPLFPELKGVGETLVTAPPRVLAHAVVPESNSRSNADSSAGYRCVRPGCKHPKVYASTDGVRKHCRKKHPEWIKCITSGQVHLYATAVNEATREERG